MNTTVTPRAARLAVLILFFVNGTVLSSWVPHIPLVKERLGLSEGVLGLALLGMAVGAIAAMPLAGVFIARLGSQRVMRVATVAFCLSLPLPVLAPTLPFLVIALVIFGAGNGAMDVAMNAQAVGVEKAHGGAIMSSFHAFFSVGGLAGSSLGGLLLWAGVSPAIHVILVTSVFGSHWPRGAAVAVGRQGGRRGGWRAHLCAPHGAASGARPARLFRARRRGVGGGLERGLFTRRDWGRARVRAWPPRATRPFR